jgi:hypothetical protein
VKPAPPGSDEPDAAPFQFRVEVKSDPDGDMQGAYLARCRPRGLRLERGDEKVLLPIGAPARYLGGNRFEVELDGRPVQMAVSRDWRTALHRLTRDVVGFLEGKRPALMAADYVLPIYLFVPVVLPLGIPILTLGGALPAAAGFGLTAACFAIAQQERLSRILRVFLMLGVSGLAYAALIGLLLLSGGLGKVKFGNHDAPTIAVSKWQPYRSPEGDVEALFPGAPTPVPGPFRGAVQVKLSSPEVTFQVHWFDVDKDQQVDETKLEGGLWKLLERWPQLAADYPQPQANITSFTQVNNKSDLSFQMQLLDLNHKLKRTHGVQRQFRRFGDRVYCATVSTPDGDGLAYDLDKFFQSVRIQYPR